MQAKDVMTVNVISVAEGSPVHQIVELMLRHRISGVPVVDDAGKVVGIVSEGDLLRPEGEKPDAARPWWLQAILAGGKLVYDRTRGRTAGEVMTRNVVAVEEGTPLNEIAGLLERHHIKRVPVLRDGRLAGIVSRANLLHGLADTIVERHEPGAAADRQLRDRLMQALLTEHALDDLLVNVTVSGGNVRLWGVAQSTGQAAAAERVARSVPGVKSIENNLGPGPVSGVPI